MKTQKKLEEKLINLVDEKYLSDDYYFDLDEAVKFKTFVEKLQLPEAKKGTKIKLLDFQLKIAIELLGIKRKRDKLRRFREVYITMPRKQAKTFIAVLIMLYLFFTDAERGQQNIIVNNSINQANYAFEMLVQMVKSSPTLMQYCRIVPSRRKIVRTNGSFIQVMSNDPERLDSFNPYLVLVDETHADKTRGRSYGMLQQGMGQRDAPLIMSVTTASNGTDETNLEYEKYLYALQVESGEIKDDAFYSAIFKADDGADLLDKEQWIKSNPAIDLLDGGFRKSEELERLAKQAVLNPVKEPDFRRFYLNQHVVLDNEQAINMNYWNDEDNHIDDISFLKGKTAYAGLDLSVKKDFSALILVIPHKGDYYIIPHLFKPSGTLEADEISDRFPYVAYAKQNYFHSTQGDHVNFRHVRHEINELSRIYDIKEIAFDNFASGGIASDLINDGHTLIDTKQGYYLSPIISDFYELLFDSKLKHTNNPVLNWMAQNTIAKENPNGKIMFDREKSSFKIDGIIALLMALGRAINAEKNTGYDANDAFDAWNDMMG
jgi:phage terminase large subunit-like protein